MMANAMVPTTASGRSIVPRTRSARGNFLPERTLSMMILSGHGAASPVMTPVTRNI